MNDFLSMVDRAKVIDALEISRKYLINIDEWTKESIRKALMDSVDDTSLFGCKVFDIGMIFHPVRVALSGKKSSPGTEEVAYVLGKEETINRINLALKGYGQ